MRLVQVTIPAGKREAVLGTLDDEGIDYVVTDETSGREYTGVVYFPLPTSAVEEVLDSLRGAGLGEDAYTVVVDAETVISRRFAELEERYEAENDDGERVARQELRARAADLMPATPTYAALTVVSVVVATAGVLLDSPAVVVGSMVIAPLIGPAMATSVGTVVADRDLFGKGVRLQAFGAVLSILAATAFAALVRAASLVPPGLDPLSIGQVSVRAAPGVLDLAVALGAGVAGALSLSAPVSAALVGVAIAVALVPPVAVIGIGLAWGRPAVAVGALVLVLVNFLSINVAAMTTLWWSGYRPERVFDFREARAATLRRVAALLVAIAVLSVFLGGTTLSSVQGATFEEEARTAVADTLEREEYAALELLSAEVTYAESVPFRRPSGVVVTVGRPAGGRYPDLAATLDEEIAAATGRDVAVQVRFVEVQSTG